MLLVNRCHSKAVFSAASLTSCSCSFFRVRGVRNLPFITVFG